MSAAQKPTNCNIITLMVFSILSACMAVPHMTLDGIGAGYRHIYRLEHVVGLYWTLFILGLCGGITSIVLSSYTCRAVCCRRSKTAGTVLYTPAAGGATAQAIPLGNMDLAKIIATKDSV